MARLLLLALGRRWALVACGVALALAGLIWGAAGSHQVSYENSQQGSSYQIGAGSQSGNVYVHADGSSEYFVALSGSFTPPIAQRDIDTSTSIGFVARTDTTSIQLDENGTTISEAHPIEKLIFYDKGGRAIATYTTAEYAANPNGFYDNEWPKAIWLILIGLILGVGAFLSPRLRKRPKRSASFPSAGTWPSQPSQPYQQPYAYGSQLNQVPEQYPQAAPSPPQQPGYGQPGGNPPPQPPQM